MTARPAHDDDDAVVGPPPQRASASRIPVAAPLAQRSPRPRSVLEFAPRRYQYVVSHEETASSRQAPHAMTLDRTRRRRRRRGQRALRVVRSPTHQQHQQLLSETLQMQRVVVLPTELPPEPERAQTHPAESNGRPAPAPPPLSPPPPSSASLAATQRLLLAHAQRTRHLLSHRAAVEALSRPRRREMLEEIERIKRIIRTLQSQLTVTTRSVESMASLVVHLQRITDGLRGPGDSGLDPAGASGPAPSLPTPAQQ
ncbi:hypothetical protein PHYPSEUDO_012552 [Phytophthora pseudosyringae]|uniref:Uncharacterized protein n=1 Tax=Phytophthora pseudosyringae TaxID=221518 RepID=A0A8T1V9Z8_9STRA|nr:hypothetical protein PHYPSEUDO_012552 [Phytophthora pseudosyringae]